MLEIAGREDDWFKVIQSIVEVIPTDDELASSYISDLILEEISLPSEVNGLITKRNLILKFYYTCNKALNDSIYISYLQESIPKLADFLKLETHLSPEQKASMDENYHRNVATVLGLVAEKLNEKANIALLTTSTLPYLISNLV